MPRADFQGHPLATRHCFIERPHGGEEISVGKKWTSQLRHGGRIPTRGADGHRKAADRKGGGPRYLLAEIVKGVLIP